MTGFSLFEDESNDGLRPEIRGQPFIGTTPQRSLQERVKKMLDFQTLIADAIEEYGVPTLGNMIEISHTTIKRWGKGECAPGNYIETYVRKILAEKELEKMYAKVL